MTEAAQGDLDIQAGALLLFLFLKTTEKVCSPTDKVTVRDGRHSMLTAAQVDLEEFFKVSLGNVAVI